MHTHSNVYLCKEMLQCRNGNDSYYTPLHKMQTLLFARFGFMATYTMQKRVPNRQDGCINITYGWVHHIWDRAAVVPHSSPLVWLGGPEEGSWLGLGQGLT